MNIALLGYGRMGREVEAVASTRGMTIVRTFNSAGNKGGSGLNDASLSGVDICVDFSSPEAVVRNIEAAARCRKNIVVGTTGWYDKLDHVRSIVRQHGIGFLYASNFSPGVNLFVRIIEETARLLERYPEYDVSISEVHHRAKADSPSGTALWLADAVLGKMKRKTEILKGPAAGRIGDHQLQISSSRVGSVTGRHSVLFDSEVDSIELVHTARSRRGFAVGAVLAAEWLNGKQGFFTMHDVLF